MRSTCSAFQRCPNLANPAVAREKSSKFKKELIRSLENQNRRGEGMGKNVTVGHK